MKKPILRNSLICRDINIEAKIKEERAAAVQINKSLSMKAQAKETAALDKRSELA